jgi:hypothetical protein
MHLALLTVVDVAGQIVAAFGEVGLPFSLAPVRFVVGQPSPITAT